MKNIQKVLIAIFVLIGIVGAYFGYQLGMVTYENNRKGVENEKILASRGIKTIAKVTNYTALRGNNGRPSLDDNGNQRYELSYQFEINGKTYSGKTFVGRKNPTEPIEIVYDPQSPENSLSPLQTPTLEPSISSVLMMVIIPVFFAIGIYTIIKKFLDSRGWL